MNRSSNAATAIALLSLMAILAGHELIRSGLIYGTAEAFDASSTDFFVRQNIMQISSLHSTAAGTGANVTTSLEGWWKLDDGSGTAPADSSGSGNTAAFVGTPTWTSGEVGGALTFNGTNQGLSTPSLNLTSSAVTLTFWAQNLSYTVNGGPALFEFSSNYNPQVDAFGIFPGDTGTGCTTANLFLEDHGNVGYNVKCFTNPGSGWHHYAAVFDKTQNGVNEIQLYVDGSLQTAVAQPNASDNTNTYGNYPLYMMSRAGTSLFESGSIDDVRIYFRALSGSEITTLYQYGGSPITYSYSTSTDFRLVGAGGEAAVGTSTSASFGVLSGYLRNLYKGPAPAYTQSHYHWRNDDGSETTATSKTSGIQDTPITSVAKLSTDRLRVEVSNKGGTKLGYSTQQFRIEYGLLSTTCAAISSWTDVGAVGGDWDMVNSANLTDGSNTTNIAVSTGGVSDENHTFLAANGGQKDTSSTASAVSVSSDSFIELEYSLQPTSIATDGGVYCFRVSNAGSTTNFTYSSYPQATLAATSLTFTVDGSSEAFPAVTPGTLVATSSILNVTTANATGFTVTAQRSDSTGTMSQSGTYIPDKTAWVPGAATTTTGNATASTTQPLTLQFRVRKAGTDVPDYASSWWGSADTTASALFAGFPSSAQNIVNRSTAAGSATSMAVLYNLNVPVTQKNGSYSGGVTYTATANP